MLGVGVPYENIALDRLAVNRANDRHGELENETAAIAELFRLREAHMKKLASDIANEGQIYDPPLVSADGEAFAVFDGNRRITCLKLIAAPDRAPTQDLQAYFQTLHDGWTGVIPTHVVCQVEDDRDRVDAILFRRHTGAQGGVGQSTWDDRAKRNFIERTGRGGRIDVADQVESILADSDMLPANRIPRSTMNRLLSSESHRARVGISVVGNQFRLTHERQSVLTALSRIATDLASRAVVLGDLWDNHGKRTYLNRLEADGILPREDDALAANAQPAVRVRPRFRPEVRNPPAPPQRTFIPTNAPQIAWSGEQQRTRAIWEELQTLDLNTHPNAICSLMRMLLELAVEGYVTEHQLREDQNLPQKFRLVADSLLQRGLLDQAYRDEIERLRQHDQLISIPSMQRYMHSLDFAPMRAELITYWTRLQRFLVACVGR
jgi:hypothetical protein